MRKILTAFAAAAVLAFAAAGCNTMQGVGKDVKAAGGALERAAEKSKSY